jgi:hypothetical protein
MSVAQRLSDCRLCGGRAVDTGLGSVRCTGCGLTVSQSEDGLESDVKRWNRLNSEPAAPSNSQSPSRAALSAEAGQATSGRSKVGRRTVEAHQFVEHSWGGQPHCTRCGQGKSHPNHELTTDSELVNWLARRVQYRHTGDGGFDCLLTFRWDCSILREPLRNALHRAHVAGPAVAPGAAAAAPVPAVLTEADVREVFTLAEKWADERVVSIRKNTSGPELRNAHDALWDHCRGLQGLTRGAGAAPASSGG